MKATAEPAELPLVGGREGASVRLHPLLTGEVLAPDELLHRSGGALAPLRAIGVGIPKSRRVWIPVPAFLVEHPGAGPLLREGVLPGLTRGGRKAFLRELAQIRTHIAEHPDTVVIPGHDPAAWASLEPLYE